MRRLHALLLAAGLATAPSSALAEPTSPDVHTETFQWSMMSSKGRLGILVMGLTPELRAHFGAAKDRGVLVGRVEPGSAAAAAGVTVGDVLVEVGGSQVDDGGDVLAALSRTGKGERVPLVVVRGKQRMTLTATLTDEPGPAAQLPRLFEQSFPKFMRDWLRDLQPDTAGRARSGKPLDTTRS